MGLLRKKLPPMPESSRFDRLDDETAYVLVEQAFSMAQAYLQDARRASDEKVVFSLHSADIALSDAQAGVRSLLRRRLVIAKEL